MTLEPMLFKEVIRDSTHLTGIDKATIKQHFLSAKPQLKDFKSNLPTTFKQDTHSDHARQMTNFAVADHGKHYRIAQRNSTIEM